MREDPDNPTNNQLPKGIDEAVLIEAIKSSGYPLQGIVLDKLKAHFTTAEEWGYIDSDTKQHRSLDIYAYKLLSEEQDAPLAPSAILLIECKRTRHPHIFFRSVTDQPIPTFPRVVGAGRVEISEKHGNTLMDVPGARVLGLDRLSFVEPGPPRCAAFSKAIPAGKDVQLSGADPFNGLVLPLIKALEHVSEQHKISGKKERLFPTVVLCIGVLDAPMVLVQSPTAADIPVLTPWVRVMRQEANPDRRSWTSRLYYAIDVVHIDFFDQFVATHLLPFLNTFKERVYSQAQVLFHGGSVDSLADWEWNQVDPKEPGSG